MVSLEEWNKGDLESFLIEITAKVLAHADAATGKPFVDIVLDQAEQKGTGRWTVQNALDLGVPITGIAEATFARALSGGVKQRQAAQGVLPAMRIAARWPIVTPTSTTFAKRSMPRKSLRTRKVSTRSRPPARSSAGVSTAARWPGSGAAAASSGRAS